MDHFSRWTASVAFVASAALLFTSSVARADESSAAGQGSRKIVLDAPEPEPVARTAYKHEGFYLRFDVGGGMVGGSFQDYGFFAGALSIDALVGGMPSPGTALGAGVFTDTVLSTKVKLDGDKLAGKRLVSIGILGPFLDGFPDANDGFHLGASAGLATNGVQDLTEGTLLGFGGVVWVGYDTWTSPEFSMGVNLRGMATRTYGELQDSNENLDGATGSLVFMVTALYN